MIRSLFCITLLMLHPAIVKADATSEAESLLELSGAHSACSVYMNFMSLADGAAGFPSQSKIDSVVEQHLLSASNAAEKLIDVLIANSVDGEKMITRKGNLFCLAESCMAKFSYLESTIALANGVDAGDEITKKKIACPEGMWSCYGAEPNDNWHYKALNLYETKNCSLLLPVK